MTEHQAMVRQLDPGDFVPHWNASVKRVEVDANNDAVVHLANGASVSTRSAAWVTVADAPPRRLC